MRKSIPLPKSKCAHYLKTPPLMRSSAARMPFDVFFNNLKSFGHHDDAKKAKAIVLSTETTDKQFLTF